MKILYEYNGKPLPRKMMWGQQLVTLIAYIPDAWYPLKLVDSDGAMEGTHEDLLEELPLESYFTDWSLVGEFWAGCAVDENGSMYFYSAEPTVKIDTWGYTEDQEDEMFFIFNIPNPTLTIPWQESWLPNPNWRGNK